MVIERQVLLADVLNNFSDYKVLGDLPTHISGISQNSELIQPNWAFVVRSGIKHNGWNYANRAIEKGASVIFAETPPDFTLNIPVVLMPNIKENLSLLALSIFDMPHYKLLSIGITGTNGKTSSTYILRSILAADNYKCGVIGTTGYDTGKELLPASLTTPDIDRVSYLLAEMADNMCDFALMEVSSHALVQERVKGISFRAAAFTNISLDHSDYHPTLDHYGSAKSILFTLVAEGGFGVVNFHDPYSQMMIDACKESVYTYGMYGSRADLTFEKVSSGLDGYEFTIRYQQEKFNVKTVLIGDFQGENIAMCALIALKLGVSKEAIAKGVANLTAVPGRMEKVQRNQDFYLFVDYAHTPDAMEKALNSVKQLAQRNIITVFGCGGNRDIHKRPLMGSIAAKLSNYVVVTSDNPRNEDPEQIVSEIVKGIEQEDNPNYKVILNREEAISYAISLAREKDVVMILGKGHEAIQIIENQHFKFDDREIAAEILEKLNLTVKL